MKAVRLLAIDATGAVAVAGEMPPAMQENCALTASFYKVIGFNPPWIGYVAVDGQRPVAGGAFKGAPQDNRVEIAYYTLPGLEGQGWATATAQALVALARSADPNLVVAAQTLPEHGASTAILAKLGFVLQGPVIHPEDGEVWEWVMRPPSSPGAPGPAPRPR
jgi:ribosomal-protein-alanine N-acetyltransferase